MTKTTTELYCSRCKCTVMPVKGLVNYHCPKCGATFMASQVEAISATALIVKLPPPGAI